MRLQEQRQCQNAGGHTGAPIVRAVQLGEVLVTKQLPPVLSQKPIEGVWAHEIQVLRMRTQQAVLAVASTEHRAPLTHSRIWCFASLTCLFDGQPTNPCSQGGLFGRGSSRLVIKYD